MWGMLTVDVVVHREIRLDLAAQQRRQVAAYASSNALQARLSRQPCAASIGIVHAVGAFADETCGRRPQTRRASGTRSWRTAACAS